MRANRASHFIAPCLYAAVLTAAVSLGMPAYARSPITVFMNHARILKLNKPVEKVIVGNSAIADVTVADPKTIVLTGKAFGTTNLVLLAKDGSAIVDRGVLVSVNEENTVRVYRQTDRSVLSCGPNCEVDNAPSGTAPGSP